MMVDDGGPMMLRPDDDDWGGWVNIFEQKLLSQEAYFIIFV
jgi:hypothetical protein